MKIGILGGTFDPVHWGHLFLAEVAREAVNLDIVYFLPAKIPPHKKKAHAMAEDRLAMLEMAIAENPHFAIAFWDLNRETPAYTYQTINEIKKCFPEDELYFIVGGDSLRDFGTWVNPEEIIKLARIVGASRPGYDSRNLLTKINRRYPFTKDRISELEVPALAISSTDIRTRVKNNKSIRYLLPDEIRLFIKDNKLYQNK